tara:strand:+ start:662 stop:1225 length:564 start_codon:yes stop_codon:yes gene_type:complete
MIEKITIPMIVESRNKIDEMHWTDKQTLKKTYRVFIRSQMSRNKILEADIAAKYSLEIITYRQYKIRDYDNLVGGAKQLLDALALELFIWDDASEYIEDVKIRQEKVSSKEEQYTSIVRELSAVMPKHKGKSLEVILRKQGRKKKWLAEKLSVTPVTVSNWVRTGHIPQVKIAAIEALLQEKLIEVL